MKIFAEDKKTKSLKQFSYSSSFNEEIISNLYSNLNSLNIIQLNQLKNIVLGGIDEKNLKKLDLINADGYAAIKLFDKKKGP